MDWKGEREGDGKGEWKYGVVMKGIGAVWFWFGLERKWRLLEGEVEGFSKGGTCKL
jgi:hypothetical protein